MLPKIPCRVCHKEFHPFIPRQLSCSDECRKIYNRDIYYHNKIKEKPCKYCGNLFTGTYRKMLCSKCEQHPKRNFAKKIVNIHCYKCNEIICSEIKNITRNKETAKKSEKVCKNCYNLARIANSKNKQKENNPNYTKSSTSKYTIESHLDSDDNVVKIRILNPDYVYRRYPRKTPHPYIRETVEQKQKRLLAYHHRMKAHNPMYNPDIINKVKNTRNKKVESGELKYKKGKEHHLWTGNAKNANLIRRELKDWRIFNLKKADYKCEECHKRGGALEIHHLEPLRTIIEKFIRKPLNEYHNESKEFQELCGQIKEYHDNDNVKGRVLCIPCHAKIDLFRRQTLTKNKYENQENHQEEISRESI